MPDRKRDLEIQVMQTCVDALARLQGTARRRSLAYICARCEVLDDEEPPMLPTQAKIGDLFELPPMPPLPSRQKTQDGDGTPQEE